MAVELLSGAGSAGLDWGDVSEIAGLTALTVAYTINADQPLAGGNRLISQWGNSPTETSVLSSLTDVDEIGFVVYGSGYFGVKTVGADPLLSMSRVVLTWATGTPNVSHIWINGVDVALASWIGSVDQGSLNDATAAFQLGYETDESVFAVDGDYSEVAVWDHVIPDWMIAAYSGGFSPRFYRNGGILYTPCVNTDLLIDEWGGRSVSQVAAADAPHPRIYQPVGFHIGKVGILYEITGITLDKSGGVLGSCEVALFRSDLSSPPDYEFIASTTSNAVTGAYSFNDLTDPAARYMVFSIRDDTPHVYDATDNVLQPVAQ